MARLCGELEEQSASGTVIESSVGSRLRDEFVRVNTALLECVSDAKSRVAEEHSINQVFVGLEIFSKNFVIIQCLLFLQQLTQLRLLDQPGEEVEQPEYAAEAFERCQDRDRHLSMTTSF